VKRNKDLTEFSIPGGQVFKPLDIIIPGDFSSAAFILGAAALTGSTVEMKNLDVKSAQGDKRIVGFLEDFGADVVVKGKSVQVVGSGELSGIDADCGDTPDLVPVLAVIGSLADAQTRLSNIPHLRMKETDRLRALAVGLREFGAEIKELQDGLHIRGVKELKGAKVDSFGDHRMAMAFAVAGLVAKGQTLVSEAESIPVSYPTFVEDMRKLGAKIELVE
jgi:3-phosphoshikimate 1-carboxyvinyltransferase